MKHIKAGYVVHSELKNVTKEDSLMLDVINVAFAQCTDGVVTFAHDNDMYTLAQIRRYNPDIKILLSVGGWGAGGFSIMSSSAQSREKFALSCVDAVKKYKLDGIDIDWEYPGIDWAGIDASPDDKENFTLMLSAVRAEFDKTDKNLMLTIAVGCDSYYIEHTQMDRVAGILDYISIMTYDMRGCGDEFTGHHTNLLTQSKILNPRDKRSVLHSVEIYANAGVPKEKMIIGIAMYSRMWKNVSSCVEGGLHQHSDPGNYGPSFSDIYENYLNKNNFIRYWDDECKAPWLFDGETFISYDDEMSIAAKCDFVRENGLLGVMYWEHSCDNTRILLTAINKNI